MSDQDFDENKDPMFPETGAEDGENNKFAPEKPEDMGDGGGGIADNISKRLEQGESASAEKHEGGEGESPIPFDLSKLSKEQLQSLKSALAATPDAPKRKKGNPKVRMRRVDGNLVVDFQNAYLGLVEDAENHRQVERHLIPVKFQGSDKFVPIRYAKFINSEQVWCEVLSTRQKVEEFVEGETTSRETSQLVDMIRKEIHNWFTIKLPDGSELEIEAKMANA